MSVIQINRQTSLSGRPLQNAISAMIQQMRGMSPYNMLNVQTEWESGSRLTLRAGNHMTGAVDIRFGPPSIVTAQINLLSSMARGQESRVRSDMLRLAQEHLPLASGVDSNVPTHAPPAAPEQTSQPTYQPQQQQQQQSGSNFNWNIFGNIMTGLLGGATQAIDTYNQVGQGAAEEAVAVAQEEAQSAQAYQGTSGKQPSPIGPNTSVQQGPGFTLGPGKEVGPNAPLPGGRRPSDVPPEEGATEPPPEEVRTAPTWLWWALGMGGVVGIGTIVYFATRGNDKPRRNDEDYRRAKIYKKISSNYGFRYFS